MHIINRKRITFTPEAKSYLSHFVPRGRKEIPITLNSFIDIFTILLIFLLKSYSSSGFAMPLTPGIDLPEAGFFTEPAPAVIISVTRDSISMDGKRITSAKYIHNQKDDLIIKPLNDALITVKENREETARLNRSVQFTGNVIIEGDKDIPFELLQKILFTCGQTGFGNVNLAVIKK